MKRLNKSLFLATSMAIVSSMLVGCSAEVPEEPAAEPYEGDWHACVGDSIAFVIRFDGGQYYQGFAIYPGDDCAAGGTFSLVSDPGNSSTTGIDAIENVGTTTTDVVTGVPSGFTVTTNTFATGIWANTVQSWVMYKDETNLYMFMPMGGGTYANGQTSTTHATWDEWLTETEVAAMSAAVTAGTVGSHSAGSGYFIKFTAGTL